MRRLWRWTWRSLLLLLLLLLLLAAALFLLAGTDGGFRFAGKQAEKHISGLDLGRLSGNLGKGIDTDAFRFENETMSVEGKGIDTNWRLGCVVKREVCIDSVTVDEVTYTALTEAVEDPSQEKRSTAIELPAINIPVTLNVDDILVRKFIFKPFGDAPPVELEDIHLSVHSQGQQISLDDLSLKQNNIEARAMGTVNVEGDYPIELSVFVEADKLLEQHGVTLDLDLSNTLTNLDIAATLSGAAQATLQGKVQPLEANIPAKLVLDVQSAGWPLDTLDTVSTDNTSLSLDGTLDDFTLALKSTLSGSQVPPTDIALNGLVNTERLDLSSININTLNGSIGGTAALSWLDGLNWETALDLANLDPSVQLQDLTGDIGGQVKAQGAASEAGWTLDLEQLDLGGTLQNFPLKLTGELTKSADDVWNIEQVKLDNGNNRVALAGTVSESWDVTGDIKLPEMQNFLPGLAGGFNASLDVSGALMKPSVSIDTNSRVLKYQDVLINGLRLRGDIKELFEQNSDLLLAIGSVDTAGQHFENLRLRVGGSRDQHTVNVFGDGPQATAVKLDLEGSLDTDFSWQGKINGADLDIPAHKISLDAPLALQWDNTRKLLSAEPHCWVTEGSKLCLEDRVEATEAGQAHITLDTYSLERLEPFLPAGSNLGGDLGLDAVLTWNPDIAGGFKADLKTAINDGRIRVLDDLGEPVEFRYQQLSLTADAGQEAIDATLNLQSENLGSADIVVNMQEPTGPDKPISGSINLDGFNIGVVKALVPDLDKLSGTISINGDIAGQLTDPLFTGTVVLDKPVVESELIPLELSGGRVTVNVDGKKAVIDGVINSRPGQIDIGGSADWQLDAWLADITIDGKQLNIRQEPLLESNVNPSIRIAARPGVIRIRGLVSIPAAIIDVGDLPPGATGLSSDVVIIEDEAEKKKQQAAAAQRPLDIDLEMDISLGEDVELDAYGLKANLSGDMSMQMKNNKPLSLDGKVEVVDGVFRQYGQDLEANGEILFVGPIDQSQLAIKAVRQIRQEDRVAGLNIGGTVETPEITLFTNPADKSDESILSYIVLGRDLGDQSGEETNLLAAAALALTVRGGRAIGQNIANALGIQEFSLESRGSGDGAELVVSGRINDRLLLRYGSSVFSSQNTLYLRYDLTRKLYLEAAQGAEQAVDIFYSFAF